MRVWTDERKSKAIQHKAEGMTYRDIAQMFTNLYVKTVRLKLTN